MVVAEAVECAAELVAQRNIRDVVARCNSGRGDIDHIDPPAPMAALLRPAIADDHPVCPALEAGRVTQAAEVTPDGNKRLLDGVLGGVTVAKDATRDEEQARRHLAGEPLVRVPIAPLCLLDQPLAHRLPCAVALGGALTLSVAQALHIFQSRALGQSDGRPCLRRSSPDAWSFEGE